MNKISMSSHLWKFVILYRVMVKLCSPPGWQLTLECQALYPEKTVSITRCWRRSTNLYVYMTFTHFCSPASVKMGGSYWGLLLHVSMSDVRLCRWDSVGPQIFKNLLNFNKNLFVHVCCHFSHMRLFVTLWTLHHQVSLSMDFSRQGY